MARRREYQLHQQLECRGLAGAVGTEEPEHLALPHVEREPIEGAIGALAPESEGVVFGELECRESRDHRELRNADCGLRIKGSVPLIIAP